MDIGRCLSLLLRDKRLGVLLCSIQLDPFSFIYICVCSSLKKPPLYWLALDASWRKRFGAAHLPRDWSG
ncbi:hypothetical protein O3P69_007523 [Scylla paramamosain]|uniref:Uncharacterized protein n=1 Tax=Scylla paramamosain TaxID=85552 RepID=A0AAW0V563_SCYPA